MLNNRRCVPCKKGDPPLPEQKEDEFLKEVPNWVLIRDGTHRLKRQFKFKDFKEAMGFVNKIAKIAQEEGHHPDIYIFYNKVNIELFTHAVGGLSENDFIMCAKIDSVIDIEL